jgi:hypothetical protein
LDRLRCVLARRSARRGAKGDAGASAERRNAAGARQGATRRAGSIWSDTARRSSANVIPWSALWLGAVLVAAACQPTVKLEPPEKPITINVNVKLEADVRLKVEEQAKEDIVKNPEVF